MRYYKLWCYLDEKSAILDGPELPDALSNWLSPQPWDIPIPDNLRVHIEKGGKLLSYYDNPIPIIRADILENIRLSGVDNIMDYRVTVVDPKTGQKNTDYRAIKIIGALSAVDDEKSEAIELDEDGLAGKFYDKVIIDEAKTHGAHVFRLTDNLGYLVVSETVRDSILDSEDTDGIKFKPLFEENNDIDEIDPDLAGENLNGVVINRDIDHS